MWENFNVWVLYFPVWLVRKYEKILNLARYYKIEIKMLNENVWVLSLSLTLFSSCDLSLSCVVCLRVYGCLAVGLGIAILVGMWPCMYVDVNEWNVCSVCMFLIWTAPGLILMGLGWF